MPESEYLRVPAAQNEHMVYSVSRICARFRLGGESRATASVGAAQIVALSRCGISAVFETGFFEDVENPGIGVNVEIALDENGTAEFRQELR